MSDVRKVWKVDSAVLARELEQALNALADDSYQVHSVHLCVDEAGAEPLFTVIAFDPMLIMKKQGEAMASTLTDLMGKVTPP